MKKFSLLLFFLLCVGVVSAQKMTDDQVIEYVMAAQEKGDSQQQIAKDLLRRGVTMDQVNRIKRKMENQKSTGVGATMTEKERTRKAPAKNGAVELQSAKQEKDKMNATEREEMMTGELGFLFPDSTMMYMAREEKKKEIFGHRIFQNKDVTFEASYNLPTPANYKLGSGDEVVIDIWGASQSTIQETISPDGNIYVENLGPVHLSGLTVTQANNYLKKQLGQIYSSISGDEPESNIRLSLAQNRTIQVHVMGEVENPGTYAMSSFATIFNALYQAGGVNEVGTLREVKVYRNDKMVATYDVYDFILNGNSDMGIRLEDNDVVSVDAYKNLVSVTGNVKRPMYYEVLDNETLAQLMKYAGGFAGNAYKEDVRLIRNGKREREIYTLNAAEQQSFILADGDSVSVDSIMPSFANMVEVKGAVYRPGQFQMDGRVSTVKQLIECAGGLKDDAFMNRAILNRRNSNNTMENLAINLEELMSGKAADVALRKNDVLLVPSLFDMQEVQTVKIFGEVAFPGMYEYVENMSVEDFIVNAGGLTEAASTAKVDVARRVKNSRATSASDTISHMYSFAISDGLIVEGNPNFTLMPFDEVYVRKSPGYFKQENVVIEGEVLFNGTYALEKKNQRLSELVASAGGLTPQAYAQGARLVRAMTDEEKARLETTMETSLQLAKDKADSLAIRNKIMNQTDYPVGIELDKALAKPGSDADVTLRDGDRLIIPQYSNTVKMSGEVMYVNTVSYKKGKGLNYYLDQAGGYSNEAKKSKVYIVYMNGTVARANRLNRNAIQPGCEIVVPVKDKERLKTTEILSLGSTSASLATVIIALTNILRK
ncbi:MAG: SLBB domain-containing protein [Bacteroidaceae bacterium]|nr:SLBB domain-containing protein [Bacteroidaceae bacterium]MBR5148299.1 SLBB domain-containing protein [Bacteroidaceae bacterium]